MAEIRNELLFWLRNNDFLSTNERNVTTDTDYTSFSNTASYLIDVTNVKNIRTIDVGGDILVYGKDYDYTVDYDDAGTIKTMITFATPQTGDAEITYDYGSDKIWDDFPRDDLKITSYPRISLIQLNKNIDAFGIGGDTFISEYLFSIMIYSPSQLDIRNILDKIEKGLKRDSKKFASVPYLKPVGVGTINKPEGRSQTILLGNIDCTAMFEVSTN